LINCTALRVSPYPLGIRNAPRSHHFPQSPRGFQFFSIVLGGWEESCRITTNDFLKVLPVAVSSIGRPPGTIT
jgi:hypothetical protein